MRIAPGMERNKAFHCQCDPMLIARARKSTTKGKENLFFPSILPAYRFCWMRIPASIPWAMQLTSIIMAKVFGAMVLLAANRLEKPKVVHAMTKGQGDSKKRPK